MSCLFVDLRNKKIFQYFIITDFQNYLDIFIILQVQENISNLSGKVKSHSVPQNQFKSTQSQHLKFKLMLLD